MICRIKADINNLLVTYRVLKFLFDPYSAIMDVDATLQLRKQRYREMEHFTQGCTANKWWNTIKQGIQQ